MRARRPQEKNMVSLHTRFEAAKHAPQYSGNVVDREIDVVPYCSTWYGGNTTRAFRRGWSSWILTVSMSLFLINVQCYPVMLILQRVVLCSTRELYDVYLWSL